MDSDTLPLSRSTVDRDARRRTAGIESILTDDRVRVLQVRRGRVAGDDGGIAFGTTVEDGIEAAYLGCDEDGLYVADLGSGTGPATEGRRALDDPQGPPAGISVRDAGWLLAPRDAGLATAAIALANWHASHRFCPRCGEPTRVAAAGWERHCTVDGSAHYPRTDPAVIMAIVDDDDRLLLGHAVGWPAGQFSVPAGFVEPGESLEEAVVREVREEVGVELVDLRYFSSQPWPFPNSLMVGFTARWAGGEIRPQEGEIEDARWFTPDDLPLLPFHASIARSLIEDFLARVRG